MSGFRCPLRLGLALAAGLLFLASMAARTDTPRTPVSQR